MSFFFFPTNNDYFCTQHESISVFKVDRLDVLRDELDFMLKGCVMVWKFGCRPVNGETRVQCRASPREICGG